MKKYFFLILIFLFSLTPSCLCESPVFNEDVIPLTVGGNFGISNFLVPSLKVGDQRSVSNDQGTIILKMTNTGLQLLKDNIVVWGSPVFTKSEDMVTQLISGCNLCVKTNSKVDGEILWCINSGGIGGRYLNILPAGSYNREWGIVIQDQEGKMVWGRFGSQILVGNSNYLIPGSYLGPSNIDSTRFITNGRDYLVLNSDGHAISMYTGFHPLSYPYRSSKPLKPIWSKGEGGPGLIWSFKDSSSTVSSDFCVSMPGSDHCEYATYSAHQNYILLPQTNAEISIDNTWALIGLSGALEKTFSISGTALPVFKTDKIPLTENAHWKYDDSRPFGFSLEVGDLKLIFNENGLALYFQHTPVWSPISFYPPIRVGVLTFGTDGNLCVNTDTATLYCIYSIHLGGRYLNLLPPGSYGREWGMVIQDSDGQMVWGVWGDPVLPRLKSYPLIPGSFIEIGKSMNKFITNGQDYLSTAQKDAIALYKNINPFYLTNSLPTWSITKSSPTIEYILSFQSDSNLCLREKGGSNQATSFWCNNVYNQKYLVLPIDNSNLIPTGSWGWVTLNAEKQVSYVVSDTQLPVFDTKRIPLTTGGYINATSTKFYTSGKVISVGKTELSVTANGPKLYHNGVIVWQALQHSSDSAGTSLGFGNDGNLCSHQIGGALCTYSENLGGLHLNILPAGSYGREWGMVIQNQKGRMVWGVWGNAISEQGNLPLIPGNFIDRLDPDNNQLSPSSNSFITSGSDYLIVNPSSNKAISLNRVNPISNPLNSVWSKASLSPSSPYNLFFKSSTYEVCIGLASNGVTAWCNGAVGKNQRYLVVPLPNKVGLPIDNNYWAWVTLDGNKQIIYTEANRPSAVFDLESIPLTTGASSTASSASSPFTLTIGGQPLKVGDLDLRMESDGLKLVNSFTHTSVWQPYTISPPEPTAVATFGYDGNICITTNKVLFCTYSQNIGGYTNGGYYLNLLPQGSYGREFSLIIQREGRMMWGRFGKAINGRGLMPLIPGNYIDSHHATYNSLHADKWGLNFITNGRDQLAMGFGQALGFYANQNIWDSSKTHVADFKYAKNSASLYSLSFGGDQNMCVHSSQPVDVVSCNMFVNVGQRYLVIPITDSLVESRHWAFATFDSDMKLVYAKAGYMYHYSSTSASPFNAMANLYNSFDNNIATGVITYKNQLDGSTVAQFKPSNLNNFQLFISKKDKKQPEHSFVFQIQRTTKNFQGENCVENIHRIAMIPRLSLYHTTSEYNSAFLGYCYLLPELLLMTSNYELIASPQVYNNTIYNPKY